MLNVVKLGGSVLRDSRGFERAAVFIANRLASNSDERLIVVVSAQHGATDNLLAEAAAIADDPDQTALDLLWSTGELRSVALLALHLQRLHVKAHALNVHQSGLLWEERCATVRPLRLHAALARARVVIVPGFLAVGPGGTVRSLGRGGSDLTAILLAAAVGADRCELIKDVPGYHTADPHVRSDAQPIAALSIADAVAMAAGGCELVQPAALEAARARDLRVIVRSLEARAPVTEVYPETPPSNAATAGQEWRQKWQCEAGGCVAIWSDNAPRDEITGSSASGPPVSCPRARRPVKRTSVATEPRARSGDHGAPQARV